MHLLLLVHAHLDAPRLSVMAFRSLMLNLSSCSKLLRACFRQCCSFCRSWEATTQQVST